MKLALTDPELALALAEAGEPHPKRVVARVVEPPVAGFLANPHQDGYGRQWQWPFNHRMALQIPSYRKGVRLATRNAAFASNWRHEALKDLHEIDDILAQQEATYWDIVAEEVIQCDD